MPINRSQNKGGPILKQFLLQQNSKNKCGSFSLGRISISTAIGINTRNYVLTPRQKIYPTISENLKNLVTIIKNRSPSLNTLNCAIEVANQFDNLHRTPAQILVADTKLTVQITLPV